MSATFINQSPLHRSFNCWWQYVFGTKSVKIGPNTMLIKLMCCSQGWKSFPFSHIIFIHVIIYYSLPLVLQQE